MTNLIVEDQTGLPNANSYCSADEYREFALLHGYGEIEDDRLVNYLARATHFIDSYESIFVGKRLSPSQALAFPRVRTGYSCNDEQKHLYSMSNLKKAILYAVVGQNEGLNLLPTQVSKDDFITKEKIEGAVEVQYSSDYGKNSLFAKYPMIDRLMSEYIMSNNHQLEVSR